MMSNQIKNTLFKFVTMRAPELSDKENQNKRFVFRPSLNDIAIENKPFDNAVQNKEANLSKWDVMKTVSFDPLNEEQIKEIDQNLSKLGVWIAKNKYSFTVDQLSEAVIPNIGGSLSNQQKNTIWNNLFYQTITQKDFYAKEALMQLLVACHVLENYDDIVLSHQQILSKKSTKLVSDIDLEFIKAIVNAKVVLPKELFVEDATHSYDISLQKKAKDNFPQETFPNQTMKQLQTRIVSKSKIQELENLKIAFQKVEKIYFKNYQIAYDKAKKEYDTEVETLLESYRQEVERVKKDWCAVKDPNIKFDPADPCQQMPLVPQPKIPEFVFEFHSPIDDEFLKKYLNISMHEMYRDFFLKNSKTNSLSRIAPYIEGNNSDPNTVFDELYQAINEEINAENAILVNNTSEQATTFVNSNGVFIPVNTQPQMAPFSYIICPREAKGITQLGAFIQFDITTAINNPDVQLQNVTTKVIYKDGSICNGNFYNYEQQGNQIFLSQLHQDLLTVNDFENNSQSLQVILYFDDDTVKTITVDLSTGKLTCYKGILQPLNTHENLLDQNNQTSSFIPLGFGMKQLGIADYKKVEQTVHGYVEGEVAHIENIMAREYKEKATRKFIKSENTTTTTSETEKERLSDTTTANRFELQNEVAKVLQEAKDYNVQAGVEYSPKFAAGNLTLHSNIGMATHSSKEESTRAAQTQAQEVTERAMERLVTKVKEERVEKIIEEFEENNKHGFDNTKGDKHVIGVYRWVDKIFKNKIYNYGKRLMFEFMVPEPAKLHTLGVTIDQTTPTLVAPIDPRKAVNNKIETFGDIDEQKAKYWSGVYNVELKPVPDSVLYVGTSFNQTNKEADIPDTKTGTIKIPDGYITTHAQINFTGMEAGGGWDRKVIASVGNKSFISHPNRIDETVFTEIKAYKGEIPVAMSATSFHTATVTINVKCVPTIQLYSQWQQETFKAIVDAYENALSDFNATISTDSKQATTNPGFFRQIENTILRKNCISYMVDQTAGAKHTYGRKMTKGTSFSDYGVKLSPDLDDYTAFAKFLEQAFEWDFMSYHLYPYYWGESTNWKSLYQNESIDPIFRNFLQAGMARVVVTVRPGFEEAVRFYMQTGQIWNGGEVPVIDEPLYLSIVDELHEAIGKPEGKAWWTRIPTALTILQAKTIGLNVAKALPYNDDISDFEDPTSVPQSEGIVEDPTLLSNTISTLGTAKILGKINGNQDLITKVVLKKVNGDPQDITYIDNNGNWALYNIPAGKYELLLDAENDLVNNGFTIIQGSKEQVVELSESQTLEINLEVKKL